MTKTRHSICLALAFAAAACTPAAAPANAVPEAAPLATFDRTIVGKLCDSGRAVYVANNATYQGGTALVVVDNAPECAQ